MSEEKILNTINEEIVKLTPDNYDEIVSKTKTVKQDNIIFMPQKKNNAKKFLSLAAAFAIVVCALFAFYGTNGKIDSVIDIDVNPSIEISINSKEKIVKVDCLNEDANIILDGMDLKGVNLNIAINAIIGSMLKNGYITDINNAVLVSVSNSDTEKQATLLKQLCDDIDSALSERQVEGAVLSQSLTHEESVAALAYEYGISEGKAMFINYICSENPKKVYEDLVDLSISELAFMAETSQNNHGEDTSGGETKVSISGEVNKSQYIGEEKAKSIAFVNAQVNERDILNLSVEIEREDGVLVYEVEFKCDSYEYEYEINALNGSIVAKKTEADITPDYNNESESTDYIGEAQAKKIAYTHAQIAESNVEKYKASIDDEDGIAVYEIEFTVNGTEYEYDIDAVNGQIIEFESKNIGLKNDEPTDYDEYIGEGKAKSLVLSHANVSENDVREFEIKLEAEDDTVVYEIEFKAGEYEYEYEINAFDGTVISYEIDD